VIGFLAAAVPVAAAASEDILKSDVQRSAAQFDLSLSEAIATGLDPVRGDELMWRYKLVMSGRRTTWWKAPSVERERLDRLAALFGDLRRAYTERVGEERDGFLRSLHHWSEVQAEARDGGVTAEGLDDTRARFTVYAALASTPNDLSGIAHVLAAHTAILVDRLASYRAARSEAEAALASARAALADASRYPELTLDAFRSQITLAVSAMASVHSAADFPPIQERLQQAAIGIHGLLDARAAAYALLADTRATLSNAQSIKADVGGAPATINSLAQRLPTTGDQSTFEWITARLYQQKQALAEAILLKQLSDVIPANPGVGKSIVISLSRQVLTAYQDGNPVLTTFVTTGRPDLATPPGVYRIMAKYSPFQFVSPWAYGSPYWYPPSWTTYAMLFRSGGFFIHDAPWRAAYGPGVNFYNGSHGCVNVPFSPMTSLWNWTPVGTTVIVQP